MSHAPFDVDLRSDTVTRPDAAMRATMAAAEVGDDVLEGDPTTRRLEEVVADLLGHEAGVFVASGTQGNLTALLSHGTHRRAIVAGQAMHVQNWEAGGHAALGGAPLALLPELPTGLPDPAAVAEQCAIDNPHIARAGLLWAENTHGGMGGLPVTASDTRDLRAVAPDLPLHVDGARLVDAAVALDTEPAMLVDMADSATLCLSKGLGCPVGTVLAGSEAFIAEARRVRKLLGSGMRQSGIIAAAGLHVLEGAAYETTREALAAAHVQARRLTDALTELSSATDPHDTTSPFDPSTTRTNLVRFGVDPDRVGGGRDAVVEALGSRGIGALRYGAGIRLVTHRGLDAADVDRAIEALRSAMAG